MTSDPVIRTADLHKTFGSGANEVHALAGIDLEIESGTVFGLLGHNGSGKTTLIRILSTLTTPSAGRAWVAGTDVGTEPARVRQLIRVTAQDTTLDERLSGRENLDVLGRLQRLSPAAAKARATELLEHFGIAAAGDRPVRSWSGGMRRRLDIASSLIRVPRLLFLDEPTTGLDPASRSAVWSIIAGLPAMGTSVFLTTQYLEEADRLADRVAVLESGTVIAEGTPTHLKARIGRRLTVALAGDSTDSGAAGDVLRGLGVTQVRPDAASDDGLVRLTGVVASAGPALPQVLRELTSAGCPVADIGMHEPTLDEAYLSLIGGHAA